MRHRNGYRKRTKDPEIAWASELDTRCSLEDLAKTFGCSKQAVEQSERSALRKVYRAMWEFVSQ